jgi:hypothetical protein
MTTRKTTAERGEPTNHSSISSNRIFKTLTTVDRACRIRSLIKLLSSSSSARVLTPATHSKARVTLRLAPQ